MSYAGYGANIARVVVGQTYGSRMVVREAPPYKKPNGYGERRWECCCMVCARIQIFGAHEILNPQGKVCPGCRNRARMQENAPIKRVLQTYKTNARKRGLEWALTEDAAYRIFASVCHYCGVKPSNFGKPSKTPASDPQLGRGVYYTGIDRIDNTVGYVSMNVVPCCRTCNWAKGKKSHADFVAWLDRIVSFRTALSSGVEGVA